MAESIHIPRNQNQIVIPSFDAVIPAFVRYDSSLSGDAKLLYGEIRALTSAYGFSWATNEYFAKLYNVDVRTIKRWLKQLEDAGHIVQTKERDDETGLLVRIIRLKFPSQEEQNEKMDKVVQNSGQNCPKKMDKTVHKNNTSNINNNIYNRAHARITQQKNKNKSKFQNFEQRDYGQSFFADLERAMSVGKQGDSS